jgi:preprotein translocase subunit SecG
MISETGLKNASAILGKNTEPGKFNSNSFNANMNDKFPENESLKNLNHNINMPIQNIPNSNNLVMPIQNIPNSNNLVMPLQNVLNPNNLVDRAPCNSSSIRESFPYDSNQSIVTTIINDSKEVNCDDSCHLRYNLPKVGTEDPAVYIDEISYRKKYKSLEDRMDLINKITSNNTFSLNFENSVLAFDVSSSNFDKITSQLIDQILTRNSPSQVNKNWLQFQFRWIIWTLASLERKYPFRYFGKLLIKENVLSLIGYRYALYTHDTSLQERLTVNAQHVIYPTFRSRGSGVSGGVGSGNIIKKFKSKSTMSPLQRCTDIATLVWPVCICICISSHNSNTNTNTNTNNNDRIISITDGWWFTKACVDNEILKLIDNVIPFSYYKL